MNQYLQINKQIVMSIVLYTRSCLRLSRMSESTKAKTEVAVVIQKVFRQQRVPVQTEPSSIWYDEDMNAYKER